MFIHPSYFQILAILVCGSINTPSAANAATKDIKGNLTTAVKSICNTFCSEENSEDLQLLAKTNAGEIWPCASAFNVACLPYTRATNCCRCEKRAKNVARESCTESCKISSSQCSKCILDEHLAREQKALAMSKIFARHTIALFEELEKSYPKMGIEIVGLEAKKAAMEKDLEIYFAYSSAKSSIERLRDLLAKSSPKISSELDMSFEKVYSLRGLLERTD